MSPSCFCCLLMLLLFDGVSAALATGGRRLATPGGWTPIEDPKDPHVEEIGEFAVTEQNKLAKTDLKFQRVVKGETQVVAGINYRLVIAAEDGADSKNYEAVVWEKPWEQYRNLTSFKPV